MKTALKILALFFLVALIIALLSGSVISDFFAPQGGVFRSVSGGDSWELSNVVLGAGSIADADILSAAFHPRDNRIVYTGTRGDGLYKSLDGGTRWIQATDATGTLTATANVYDIALDPTRPRYEDQIPEQLYIAVFQNGYGRILKSEDGAQSFREVYVTSRADYPVFSLYVNARNPAHIWAGTGEGLLLFSNDFGESWEKIYEFPGAIQSILPNPAQRNDIFVSTFRDGIFRSFDGGNNWQNLTPQLADFSRGEAVEYAVRDPRRPYTLYLATWSGLLRSTNGGSSWQRVNIVIPHDALPVRHISFSSASDNLLYVAAENTVYMSNDRGEEWVVRQLPSNKNIYTIITKPDEPQVVLVGMHK